MKPAPFDYRAPTTLDEVVALLAEFGADGKLLAGGQSLVPLLNFRLARPDVLIDLNRVGNLSSVRDVDGGLAFGAMTRQRVLERDARVRERLPLLAAAAEWIAHPQIRNRGTIGGSLAHADPASEMPALALVHDATITARSESGGERQIPASEFFVTYLTTALEPGELVTEVTFPPLPAGSGWSIIEVARRHGDFALAGVASSLTLDASGLIADVRIGLFGVDATARRATAAEAALRGRRPDEEVFREAAALAREEVEPASDVHATATYRNHVVGVLIERSLGEALGRARAASGPPSA